MQRNNSFIAPEFIVENQQQIEMVHATMKFVFVQIFLVLIHHLAIVHAQEGFATLGDGTTGGSFQYFVCSVHDSQFKNLRWFQRKHCFCLYRS